jgi:hypothetical protein
VYFLIVTRTSGRLLEPSFSIISSGTSIPVVFLPVFRIVVWNVIGVDFFDLACGVTFFTMTLHAQNY